MLLPLVYVLQNTEEKPVVTRRTVLPGVAQSGNCPQGNVHLCNETKVESASPTGHLLGVAATQNQSADHPQLSDLPKVLWVFFV